MMIVMRANATQREVKTVVDRVQSCGAEAHLSEGEERTIIGVVGDVRSIPRDEFLQMPSVDRIIPISRPFKIASREFHPWNSEVPLDGIKFGVPEVVIIAGPCAVESREQLLETAHAVREAGAHVLRGGAYKPRTSPPASIRSRPGAATTFRSPSRSAPRCCAMPIGMPRNKTHSP